MKKQVAHIVFGLGFGDEGKGTMTDFLCRHHKADLVVRFNGGSQAAHNVVTDEYHHTFAQFGSGTFVSGVKTLISEFMFWDPVALVHEVAVLSPKIVEHALNRHYIDCRAPVITPIHVATNRLKEFVRGGNKHGSCGKGFGEAVADSISFPDQVIRAGALKDYSRIKDRLTSLQERKKAELEKIGVDWKLLNNKFPDLCKIILNPSVPEEIAQVYHKLSLDFNILNENNSLKLIRESTVIFEGAQGMLLDEWHGFHPYTTWSTTGPRNAMSLLEQAGFTGEVEVTGVIRSHFTRHGAGPFVTSREEMKGIHPGEHNVLNEWQDSFRFGGFDGVLFRYALQCASSMAKLTSVAVTHLDVFDRKEKVPLCERYTVDEDVQDDYICLDRITGQISDLVPNYKRDLKHQEELTKILCRAKPVYGLSFVCADDVVDYVTSAANAPVKFRSFGSNAKNKGVL